MPGPANINVTENGPYIVKGEFTIRDSDGNPIPGEAPVALCRCGASSAKPFCDGTHSKMGFDAASAAREARQRVIRLEAEEAARR